MDNDISRLENEIRTLQNRVTNLEKERRIILELQKLVDLLIRKIKEIEVYL